MSKARPVTAWEIWANPILKRYWRSRLRLRHLLPWALLTLIVALFVVFFMYTISERVESRSWEDGARIALIPLVILQMFLLMFVGTGSVAAGIARESIDGMIDYQRLTPMTPTAKIVGYLFGLPIREYVLTAMTLPFVIFCGIGGSVALEPALKFYSVFFSSVILYHLTGLVAGSVVKRKFLAGRTAQFMVVLLYLVLPRFAAFGFIFLVHLTVLPAWGEQTLEFLPSSPVTRVFEMLAGDVPWFGWDFSPTTASLLIQFSLIAVFFVILSRKWRDAESHVIGHVFSVGFLVGFLAILLGNVLPLIQDGDFFTRTPAMSGGLPRGLRNESYGWFTMGMMGLAIFFVVLLILRLIVPDRHEALRGFRRVIKRGRASVPWYSDDNSSVCYAVVLIVLGWLGWAWFSHSVLEARVFRQVEPSPGYAMIQGAGFCLPLLAWQFLLEWRGWRTAFLAVLVVWVVPPLAAVILAASGELETLAIFLAAISGPVMPFYAVLQEILKAHPPANVGGLRRVEEAFWFAVLLYTLVLPCLVLRWSRFRRKLRETARVTAEELES